VHAGRDQDEEAGVSKTPDPIEVVRDKVVPAAEELVASVAERVSPLAKEALDQVTPVAHAAVEKAGALAHAAAEKVGPAAEQARDAVAPYAQSAVHTAADAVSPVADKVAPLAHSAADKVAPLAQSAAAVVAPYAALAAEQGRKTGHDLAERLEPAYEAAVGALGDARDKVSDRLPDKAGDVLPAVSAAASGVAATAATAAGAASDKGKALVKSVRREPVVVPAKKKGGWLRTFAIVAAAAGATYVVVRRLTGDKGSQWQTARPTTPYVPPTSTTTTQPASTSSTSAGTPTAEPSTTSLYGTGAGVGAAGATGTDEDAEAVTQEVRTTDRVADADEAVAPTPGTPEPSDQGDAAADQGGSADSPFATVEGEGADDEPTTPYGEERVEGELETVTERVHEEPEDAVLAEQDQAAGVGPDAHVERYLNIPGVYVGVEPPEGYTIKGNERSMKYHLPDSNSYGRTIAEVWFLDEEAAQKAGFSRAQH
jgi:hypothetical protein